MWFDPKVALAEIENHRVATSATSATQPAETLSRVAEVANVAVPLDSKRKNTAKPEHNDAETLAGFLRKQGPHKTGRC